MPEIGPPAFGTEPTTPRPESTGEAQQRLASWFLGVFKPFGVRFSETHQQAAAVLWGPFIKRWPWLAKWKAPKL